MSCLLVQLYGLENSSWIVVVRSCIGVWRREGVREQSAGENYVPLECLEVSERRFRGSGGEKVCLVGVWRSTRVMRAWR